MFEHLKRLDPCAETSWLELPMIAPGAAVELKFAGEGNVGYFNAMLARAGKRARKVQQRGGPLVDAKMLAENRDEDRELYPVHVLVGWRGIQTRTDSGALLEADPTLENRKEFCAKLPNWIFDRIRDAAARPERFVREADDIPPDGMELAGN